MSIETIYIDSSDEITSVIEKLKASHEPIVALVVPKGAVLTQSIVNLKLAKKAAGDAEKDLILVTTDKIGRNLAAQVGINVASSEKDVAKVARGEGDASDEESASVIAGVRIHRYYDGPGAESGEDADATTPGATVTTATSAAAIVPKNLLQESPGEAAVKTTDSTAPAVPPAVETVPKPVAKPSVPVEPLKRTTLPEETIDEPVLDESTTQPVAPTPVQTTKEKVVATTTKSASEASIPSKGDLGGASKRRPFYLVGGIILIIALLASFFFLPRTTVVLTVQAKPWDQDFTITGNVTSTSVSSDGTIVPAERIKQEGEVTSSFPSTGTKRTGTAAKGSATIFNSQDSSPQTLPAGAKLEANGRTFTTDVAVSVPGVTVKAGKLNPGSATVAITAENVGTESNVSNLAANITSPTTNLYAQIANTSGGASQELKVVSPSDITNAKNALAKQLRDSLVAKLNEATANRETIFQDGSDLLGSIAFTTSLEANAEGESFQATSKGTLERLIIDKGSFTQAVDNYFKSKETASEKRLVESSSNTVTAVSFDTQTVTLTAKASGKITPVFSTENLPAELVGKSLTAGQTLVTQATPASSVTITQSPSWWPLKQFPRFAGSITIQTSYE